MSGPVTRLNVGRLERWVYKNTNLPYCLTHYRKGRPYANMSVTVLVTGGNGCLGQHVVKLMNQNADFVKKIKILDRDQFSNKLDYEIKKETESITGSITNKKVVHEAVAGVQCVLHIAGVVGVGIVPDKKLMEEVHVKGTRLLIEACKEHNVERIVYCSTLDVVIGFENFIDGTEDSLPRPKQFLFGDYAVTKCQAEDMIISVNGTPLKNGKLLRTASIRPCAMYGELDRILVPGMLDLAKKAGGTLIRFGDENAFSPYTYVGNVAWGFVCALKVMIEDEKFGGDSFFITDDTPNNNVFNFGRFFIERYGYKVSLLSLPYWVVFIFVFFLTVLAYVLSPIYRAQVKLSFAAIRYTNMKLSVSSDKARRLLRYTPLFKQPETSARSAAYYDKLLSSKN